MQIGIDGDTAIYYPIPGAFSASRTNAANAVKGYSGGGPPAPPPGLTSAIYTLRISKLGLWLTRPSLTFLVIRVQTVSQSRQGEYVGYQPNRKLT
jgi:hypothetical protein